MKYQSTLEFVMLLAGIVLVAIIITLYFYSGASSTTSKLVNLTDSQFDIFNINLYSSTSGNYIYGSYYQTGTYTYNSAMLEIGINSISYTVPISTTSYLSTTGTHVFNFKSTSISANAINELGNGNVKYIFEFIKFNYGGKNYIFVANQTELSKAN